MQLKSAKSRHDSAPGGLRAIVAPRARWAALAVICLGAMMSFVNVSATISALAYIQRDLHATATQIVWVSSVYSLVIASMILAAGTLADLFGRKRVFAAGATLFLAGSVIATTAGTAAALIAAQAVMGLGGAMILPAGLAIVSHLFVSPVERTEAVSLWATSSGLGLIVGPLGAGLLLERFSWNSAFTINLVLSGVTLAGALAFIPQSRQSGRRLDLGGIVLAILGTGALTYAIIEGRHLGYASPLILGAFAVSVVTIASFVIYELRRDDPMLDVRLFASASFSAVMGVATVTMFAFTGVSFMVVLYLMQSRGLSALDTGLLLLAMFIPFIVLSPVSGRLVHRTGFTRMLSLGLVLMATGIVLLLLVGPGRGVGVICPGLALIGVGAGLLLAPSTAAAVLSVEPARSGMASAAVNMFRQFGNVLGASVLGTVLTARSAHNLDAQLRSGGMDSATAAQIAGNSDRGTATAGLTGRLADVVTATIPRAFTDAFHVGIVIAALVVLACVVPTLRYVHRHPGASVGRD